ncbi:hypothetical protein GCM10029976_034970 [Kribbella albertanoniae]
MWLGPGARRPVRPRWSARDECNAIQVAQGIDLYGESGRHRRASRWGVRASGRGAGQTLLDDCEYAGRARRAVEDAGATEPCRGERVLCSYDGPQAFEVRAGTERLQYDVAAIRQVEAEDRPDVAAAELDRLEARAEVVAQMAFEPRT